MSLFLIYFNSNAQKFHLIKGQVKNYKNDAIPNTHIFISGEPIGSVTNNQGLFSLKIPYNKCKNTLIFSHVEYESDTATFDCSNPKSLNIILKEREYVLDEIVIQSLSVEDIMTKVISDLENNFQLPSITYTFFTRITESIKDKPILLEEFIYKLYHDETSKPEYNIIKVRGKGYSRLGESRYKEARLIDIHGTDSHIMLRYIPDFLQKGKFKKYNYKIMDEVIDEDEEYYVISIDSDRYLKGGLIHVNMSDYGITYMESYYKDEKWSDMEIKDHVKVTNYQKFGDKYCFTHGYKNERLVLKKLDIEIDKHRVSVATDRVNRQAFEKAEEMGRMSKMLKNFDGEFDDSFWDDYNFIPLDSSFIEDPL